MSDEYRRRPGDHLIEPFFGAFGEPDEDGESVDAHAALDGNTSQWGKRLALLVLVLAALLAAGFLVIPLF